MRVSDPPLRWTGATVRASKDPPNLDNCLSRAPGRVGDRSGLLRLRAPSSSRITSPPQGCGFYPEFPGAPSNTPVRRCSFATITASATPSPSSPMGFDWQGATYPSLSAIARAITGTAWSGPRFFALARGNGGWITAASCSSASRSQLCAMSRTTARSLSREISRARSRHSWARRRYSSALARVMATAHMCATRHNARRRKLFLQIVPHPDGNGGPRPYKQNQWVMDGFWDCGPVPVPVTSPGDACAQSPEPAPGALSGLPRFCQWRTNVSLVFSIRRMLAESSAAARPTRRG